MKYVVNGNFLCRNLTGIERFSIEILNHLENLVPEDFISIYIPQNAKFIPDYKKIKIIHSEKSLSSYLKWTLLDFSNYVRKNHLVGINFSNEALLFAPGYLFIHDIYCKLYPQDFKSPKDKKVRAISCFNYYFAAKKAKKLFTVSEFSKNQIAKTYKINPEKITVIPNGWDHFKNIQADESIFNEHTELKNSFYFTLGSLSTRKNLKWIADYAAANPNDLFAISGKNLESLIPQELENIKNLKNVIFLGYVSDGQVKALMAKCKAFIFPSYYEGFGIPPLEALSVGAPVVISNAASLPEIFGKTAHYINPDDTNVDLTELLKEPVESPEKLLEHYTYENAAKTFFEYLKGV